MENKRDWECTEKEEGRAKRGRSLYPVRAGGTEQQLLVYSSSEPAWTCCSRSVCNWKGDSELLWEPCTTLQRTNALQLLQVYCLLGFLLSQAVTIPLEVCQYASGGFSQEKELLWPIFRFHGVGMILFSEVTFIFEWPCNKLPPTDNIAENKISTVPTIWLRFVGCVCPCFLSCFPSRSKALCLKR